jgi:galactosamine-6-phosphate isomerase
MDIHYFDSYAQMSSNAACLVYDALKQKEDLLLCAASGDSPKGTYRELTDKYSGNPSTFRKLRLLKLDEWGGVPMDNPQTCETFLQEVLVKPLHVDLPRYISFESNSSDPESECRRIASWLQSNGPIDVCVLGLGRNGHVAFNEPGEYLSPYCHQTDLSKESLEHAMARKMEAVPTYGLTIGMANILQSKKIILLMTGEGKDQIAEEFYSQRISSLFPASFLWLHAHVECLVDTNSIKTSSIGKLKF